MTFLELRSLLFIKLFLNLVLLVAINCQSNISASNIVTIATTSKPLASDKLEHNSSSNSPNLEAITSTNSTTTFTNVTTDKAKSPAAAATTTTTTEDVLLSSHEFVDFTETPTLLFDGTSSETNDTSSVNSTKNVTSSPNIVPTSISINETEFSNNNNVTDISSSTEPPNVITTTTPVVTTTMPAGGESTGVGGSSSDDENESTEDDGQDDPKEIEQPPFNPPQNVSQYMDYIERLFHDLRHQITDLFEPHIPQLIRTSQMVQLSSSCSYDMLRMALALRQFEPWALRMIDSSGKVPEGIFEGSFTALGSYDECLNTVFASGSQAGAQNGPSSHLSPNSAFASSSSSSDQQQQQQQISQQTQGKYCLVNVSPFLPPKPPVDRVEIMFQEEANRRNYTKDDQFSRLSPMFYYMKFRIGVCIPSTCVDSDLESISSALSSSLRLNITIPNCRVKQSQPITSHQLVGGLVFALVLALVVGATMMDYTRRKSEHIIESEDVFVLSVPTKNNELMAKQQINNKNGNAFDRVQPVLLRKSDSFRKDLKEKNTFSSRLDKNWSWMSFSFLTNYKLYFKHKNPIIDNRLRQQASQNKLNDDDLIERRPLNTDGDGEGGVLIIKCLNGIRVLSLCWVIIANSYITLDPRATKLLTKTREAPKDFIFQMVAQASLAIETFFFLSGVLMSLSFARKLNRPPSSPAATTTTTLINTDKVQSNKSEVDTETKTRHKQSYVLQWIHFYVHRYIRMTPATMLVIAFTMFAYSYGDGPLWFEATHKAHMSCNKNWWRHLLHIANYIDTRQMCFIHYWYIAADMQLFLFAPILMFLIYHKRRIGYAVATLIGLMSIGSVFYTTYIRNLPPTLLFYNSDPESRREFGNTIMTKPLTHALPYMVGMLVGKWLTSCRREIASRSWMENESNRSLASIFGLLATIVALAEVFLPYKWNNSHLPTRLLSSLYAALFRFGWSLVLAYIVISCRHKQTKRCRNELKSRLVNCCTCKQERQQQQQMQPQHQQQSSQFNNVEKFNDISIREHQHHHHNHDLHQQQQQQLRQTRGVREEGVVRSAEEATAAAASQETGALFCLCGSGGNLLNHLLSLNIFTHLSKLSFVAYLIHLPLMSVFVAQTRGLFAFSHTLVIHLALSYLFMTFILSFILVHIIEFPFITFERYLFEKLFYKASNANNARNVKKSPTSTEKNHQASNGYIGGNNYKPAEYFLDKRMRREDDGLDQFHNHNHNLSHHHHHLNQQQQQQQQVINTKHHSSENFYVSERL